MVVQLDRGPDTYADPGRLLSRSLAETEVADVIAAALRPSTGDDALPGLRARVAALAARHPLYPDLGEPDLTETVR